MSYFSTALRASITGSSLTQSGLAKHVGISQPQMSRILSNRDPRKVSRELLSQICDAPGMSDEDHLSLLKAYLLDETPPAHIEELKEVFDGWHVSTDPHLSSESGASYKKMKSGKLGELDHCLTLITGKIEQELYDRTDGTDGPFLRLIKDLADICG